MEFENKFDDTLLYEILMKQLDPSYVKMQFQVAVITDGFKASTYFTKYPEDSYPLIFQTGPLIRKKSL